MRSLPEKLAVTVVLAGYVLAAVGSPLLHHHAVSAHCGAHRDCDSGSHSATDANGLLARCPTVAHASGETNWSGGRCSPSAQVDGGCPVCQFLAQEWLSTENATVPLFFHLSRTNGPDEVACATRPVPVFWRIRAPPPTVWGV